MDVIHNAASYSPLDEGGIRMLHCTVIDLSKWYCMFLVVGDSVVNIKPTHVLDGLDLGEACRSDSSHPMVIVLHNHS